MTRPDHATSGDELRQLVQEPRVDARPAVHLLDGGASAQRLQQMIEALGAGYGQQLHQRLVVVRMHRV